MQSYGIPEDVQQDERLFESNDLLRQQWQSSIQTRGEPAEVMHQRAAAEDDFRSQALGLQDSLVEEHVEKSMTQAAKDDLANVIAASEPEVEPVEDSDEVPMIIEQLEAGPVLQPLSASVPWWQWLIFGIVVLLLVLVMFGGRFWPFFTPSEPLVPAVALPVRADFEF